MRFLLRNFQVSVTWISSLHSFSLTQKVTVKGLLFKYLVFLMKTFGKCSTKYITTQFIKWKCFGRCKFCRLDFNQLLLKNWFWKFDSILFFLFQLKVLQSLVVILVNLSHFHYEIINYFAVRSKLHNKRTNKAQKSQSFHQRNLLTYLVHKRLTY